MIREKLKWIAPLFSERGADVGILFLRLFFGTLMFTHGITKVLNFTEMSAGFMDPIGLGQKTSFLLMTLTEFGASLFIILGLFTRLSALPLIFGMFVASVIAHGPFTIGGSELPLLYMGAFVAIAIVGGGRYSIDHLIKQWLLRDGRE